MSNRVRFVALLASVLAVVGCSRKDPLGVQETVAIATGQSVDAVQPGVGESVNSFQGVEGGIKAVTAGRRVVELPAGSVDGLAAAIASAGPRGAVVVKSGTHTESGTVRIEQSTRIVGEPGAVIVSTTTPVQLPTDLLDPAIHVIGVSDVIVMNLKFQPSGSVGGVGILLERAPKAIVYGNTIENYAYGVMTDHSDDIKIWKNTIPASLAWTTGDIPESVAIFVMSGDRADVTNNDCSNGLVTIFLSGGYGKLTGNRSHDGRIGVMLCHPVHDSFTLPDGEFAEFEAPANHWTVKGNDSSNNGRIGYLVIDGSFQNLLQGNSASNNGRYDVELAGDSFRFGFLTPRCHDNTFKAAPFNDVRVKDCGENNVVVGGQLVDNTAEPCN